MAETTLWVVEKDGRVIQRGFQSESAAYGFVEQFVRGLQSHREGSKIRVPDFNVKVDRQYQRDDNKIWNECKSHTQVVM